MRKPTFKAKCIAAGIFNPDEFLCKQYQKGLSTNEIAELLHDQHAITITSKAIADKIKPFLKLRTYSERKNNAIKRGRMVYFKKPESMKYKSNGISVKTRFLVMSRDDFRCQKCGGNAASGHILELHHIKGKESTPENLITLCFLCHRGLHATKTNITTT